MSELTLREEALPYGVTLITVEGELDAATAEEFNELMARLIGAGQTRLVVDIDGVTYIASAGVGVFVGHIQSCRDQGGDLVILYPSYVDAEDSGTGLAPGYNPLEVFDMLGLLAMIKLAKTREQAQALLSGKR